MVSKVCYSDLYNILFIKEYDEYLEAHKIYYAEEESSLIMQKIIETREYIEIGEM